MLINNNGAVKLKINKGLGKSTYCLRLDKTGENGGVTPFWLIQCEEGPLAQLCICMCESFGRSARKRGLDGFVKNG